jgi:hypothetical protein
MIPEDQIERSIGNKIWITPGKSIIYTKPNFGLVSKIIGMLGKDLTSSQME